jgi:hypothetical protein
MKAPTTLAPTAAALFAPKSSLTRIINGPSTTPLASLVKRLNMSPRPVLKDNVVKLRIVVAERNDHFGARHFIKEHLPRIQYSNPGVQIEIQKIPKRPESKWKAEMEVTFCMFCFSSLFKPKGTYLNEQLMRLSQLHPKSLLLLRLRQERKRCPWTHSTR